MTPPSQHRPREVNGFAKLVLCTLGSVLYVTASATTAVATAYYVDSEVGDDGHDGRSQTLQGTDQGPWRSIAKVNATMGSLRPGDSVLFRRGRAWQDEALEISKVNGTEVAPIVFGAYGPQNEPRPSIGGGRLRITYSEHIVVRDLEIHHTPEGKGPVVNAQHSGHLIVMNNEIHHGGNGISYQSLVHHTATLDNLVHHTHDGIQVHDISWGDEPLPVGSHHWILDNVLIGPFGEDGIDSASEPRGGYPQSQDLKIVGNFIAGADHAGIIPGHLSEYTWIIGNTITTCSTRSAGSLKTGVKACKISGNVLFDNPRSVVLGGDGTTFENNTVIQSGMPILREGNSLRGAVIRRNLFLPLSSDWLKFDDDALKEKLAIMDFNWFGTPPGQQEEAAVVVVKSKLSLAQWKKAYGFDASSITGPVPGVSVPPDKYASPSTWNDPAFWAHFIPATDWNGFDLGGGPAGAFDRGGKRRGLKITPFEGYEENGGYGWPGPPVVQQRYPLP